MFEIHSVAAASLYDLPAVAEGTWHGACLACAEIARRSLIGPEHLPQLIEWLSKVRQNASIFVDLINGFIVERLFTSIFEKVLIRLGRTSAMLPHTSSGHLQGPRTNLR
jgi:hypothetical protein